MQFLRKSLVYIAFIIDKLSGYVIFISLLVMTIATFSQVFCRYVLNFSIPWSEELSRFLFTWVVFAGVPSLVYRSGMTAFNLFLLKMSGWKAKLASLLISSGYVLFFYYLSTGSIPLVKRQMMQMATSIPVSMGMIYLVIPVSGFLVIIVSLERLIHTWSVTGKEL
ncbi:MAG TPA: TRAP transporter small permease [Synergistales bacterium]|nr:TRAP transporter small permease [Synergistales bacterium]